MGKTTPDPFKRELIRDAIELDAAACRVGGYYSIVVPDSRTKYLGDQITRLLLRLHKVDLRRDGKSWDGQYLFVGKYLLRLFESVEINLGVIEAIRRGWYPFEQISSALEDFITDTLRIVNSSIDPELTR